MMIPIGQRQDNLFYLHDHTHIHIITSTGGPFYIKCGEEYEKYWYCTGFDGENCIHVTEDSAQAALFSIEKTTIPDEFHIVHYRQHANKAVSTYYVSVKEAFQYVFTGIGSLQLGGPRASNFTLRSETDDPDDRNIDEWAQGKKKASRFIKRAPRRVQIRSYLALNEKGIIMRVTSLEKENYFLRFQLERVPIKDRRQAGNYFGHLALFKLSDNFGLSINPNTNLKAPDLIPPIEEEDDMEFDFEFEFDPVSDSEEISE